jgi:predicted ATPase
LEFTKKYRSFTPGDKIRFTPGVNLLVGSNGAGKSTTLGILAEHGGVKDSFVRRPSKVEEYSKVSLAQADQSSPVFAFDFESDNPRVQASLREFGPIPYKAKLGMSFASHGQSSLMIIRWMSEATEPGILILDEPDTALAPGAVMKLVRALKYHQEIGSQVIAAVHNPWLIQEFEQVWDMDKRTFRSSAEYLAEQRASA